MQVKAAWLNGGPGAVRWLFGDNCVITAQESIDLTNNNFFAFLDCGGGWLSFCSPLYSTPLVLDIFRLHCIHLILSKLQSQCHTPLSPFQYGGLSTSIFHSETSILQLSNIEFENCWYLMKEMNKDPLTGLP